MSVMNVALAQSGLGDYIFGLDPQLIFDSLITILAMFFLFLFLSYSIYLFDINHCLWFIFCKVMKNKLIE